MAPDFRSILLVVTTLVASAWVPSAQAQSRALPLVPSDDIAAVVIDADGDLVPDRLGDTVTISGVATVSAGVLYPGHLHIAVDDGLAGVFVASDEIPAPVLLGDTVVVRGVVAHYRGRTQLDVLEYQVTGHGPDPLPLLITPPPPSQESMEGRLVDVPLRVLFVDRNLGGPGPYIRAEPMWGGDRRVTIFIRTSAQHSGAVFRFREGDRIRVTGILGQYDPEPPFEDGYQIYPRSYEDLVFVGPSRTWVSQALGGGLLVLLIVLAWSFSLRRKVRDRTRELQESERQAHLLMESGPGAVLVHADGQLLYANTHAHTLLGAPAEGGVALSTFLDKGSVALLADWDNDSEEVGPVAMVAATLYRSDGTSLDAELSATTMRYHGRTSSQVWIHDVSDRRRREHERQRMEDQLQEKRRLETLGELAGGIAHDFNNLLQGVMGNAALLSEGTDLEEEDRTLVAEILKAGERAADLTRQMLSFAGRAGMSPEAVDLTALVRESQPILQSGDSRRARIEVIGGDETWVRVDRSQMQEVLLGIVSNATEALEANTGHVRIETAIETVGPSGLPVIQGTLPEGAYARLTVSDDGRGMDASTLERAFDPFFTTKFMGRGLGLASALGVARGHHGGIRITTGPGRGTAVDILLPLLPARRPVKAPETTAAGPGKILVVDDEDPVRTLAVRVLRRAGHEVLEACDGEEALDVFRSEAVTAVLLDMTMPGMDGREVLRRIRAENRTLPVILSSGFAGDDWGPTDDRTVLLAKPYRPTDLVEMVERFIAQPTPA